jgi:hypothetical protein
MHTVIGLVLLGVLIMIALWFAQIALTVVMLLVSLPVVGISALVDKFKK